MTPTNKQIQTAFNDALIAASLGYPIAFPGVDFTPPQTGVWLEVSYLPNQGIDDGVNANSSRVPRGIYQVMVFDRPGSGVYDALDAAAQVQAVFPKLSAVGGVYVQKEPYQGSVETQSDRLAIPVTIPYTG